MKIDLHTHTYYSDGTLSPSDLIKLAIERKIDILAITDHDSIKGVAEARKASKGSSLIILSGIEISAKVNCSNDLIHIVGLGINIKNVKLQELIHLIEKRNIAKINKRLERINSFFKSDISYGQLRKNARGLPHLAHIAKELLRRGYTKSVKEGIKLMVKTGPCHVDHPMDIPHSREVIKIIHDAGGIAVLAHLAAYKNEGKYVAHSDQEALIKELKSYGIDALEVQIPGISDKELKFGMGLANKYHLDISVGSDFHDEKLIPSNRLGFKEINVHEIKFIKNILQRQLF